MRTCIVFLSLLAVAFALNFNAPAINQEIIDKVNSDPTSSWVAGPNDR